MSGASATGKNKPSVELMVSSMRKTKGEYLSFEEASRALPINTCTWELTGLQASAHIGRILDHAKKIRRGRPTDLDLISELAAEAFICLENLRRELYSDVSMYQIVGRKFNIVSERVKSPIVMNLGREGTFFEFRLANIARCLTAYVDNHATLEDWSVTDWACALGGEMGELANALAEDLSDEETRHEIADVITYLDLFLARVGLDLEDCIRAKIPSSLRRTQSLR